MDFFRRLFQGSELNPSEEMKRLAKLPEAEMYQEVLKVRKKWVESNKLLKPKTQYGEAEIGFVNLGNTCFISSSFQSLLHCEGLKHYFLKTNWINDVNPCTSIALGKIVAEFYKLFIKYWGSLKQETIDLTEFHSKLIQINKSLGEYSQHDVQEFLSFFLDLLHEDLNKVIVRSYETYPDWKGEDMRIYCAQIFEKHLKQNKSIIVDLFHGQFYSRLQCPSTECNRVSISCEPFSIISLNPPNMIFPVEFSFFVVPLTFESPIHKLTLQALSSQSLREFLHNFFQERPELKTNEWRPLIYKNLRITNSDPHLDEITIGGMELGNFLLMICQVSDQKLNDLLFPKKSTPFCQEEPLETPFQEALPQNQIRELGTKNSNDKVKPCTFQLTIYNDKVYDGIQKIVEVPRDITLFEFNLFVYLIHRAKILCVPNFKRELSDQPPSTKEALLEEFGIASQIGLKLFKNGLFEIRIINGYRSMYANQEFFETAGKTHLEAEVLFQFESFSDDVNFRKFEIVPSADKDVEKHSISLKSCFEKFVQKEVLDDQNMWYCPGCKEHKRALKQISVSRLPENLIVHLKRFIRNPINHEVYHKFNELITFDIDELNLEQFFPDVGKDALYELYSVCNHYGSVNNGHYTSICRNFEKNSWVLYDDKQWRTISKEEVVTKNAYLLFYRKKKHVRF